MSMLPYAGPATGIVRKRQWCEMVPCLEDEGCDLLVNKSGWTCTQPGGRVKTTTVSSDADRAYRLVPGVAMARLYTQLNSELQDFKPLLFQGFLWL
ncbi:hypothetical protein CCH79_00014391 [Gambusia affinis]|uniref:Uncharacterized protein n=1 Tax=Gambusia affinis TaxID=33528 RepID=A0A315UWK6_GAMAF|nr:hypothetical protein CCH79_00014391 [Gambusia affinis]